MNPILYEINTRCWLRELSNRLGRPITLATVPDEEFAQWQKLGFTHIWLMGVWTTGTRARALAVNEPNLRRAYDELLPGWRKKDVAGSPYSIAAYKVPPALGGSVGLQEFRARLHGAGLKLILDFVPNHVGLDHPWLREQPELFVQSATEMEGTFAQPTPTGERWIAYGKDPYFPWWTDVAQLDYRERATRDAMKKQLLSVAERCDGVRCDMAMLLLNGVFERTWAGFPSASTAPETEFWAETIPAVKYTHPEFLFLAEVYWGLEGRMQLLGFDYTYDKQIYDDLIWRHAGGVQRRLLALSPDFVMASAHFLENHDESRVAGILALAEHRAAALVILGLPGMRFLYEGQLTGARIKVPVQLGCSPVEPPQTGVQQMYDAMLTTLLTTAVGRGQSEILSPREAWPGNLTAQNFVVVQWQMQPPENPSLTPPGRGTEFDLVVVNLAPHRSQCYVPLKLADLSAHNWSVRDLLGDQQFERAGDDMAQQGLYLDLPEHGAQVFRFTPVN